jgi:hypothetical protein
METAGSLEIFVPLYQITQHDTLEDSNLKISRVCHDNSSYNEPISYSASLKSKHCSNEV